VVGRVCFAALVTAFVAGTASAAEPTPVDIGATGATTIAVHGDWLTAGGGAVWLSDEAAIVKIDPATNQVTQSIRLQNPCEASEFGLGALWTATCAPYGLARINPATGQVVFLRMRITRAQQGEASVGVGAGAAWVVVDTAKCSACRVARVSSRPASLRVVKRIPVLPGAAAVRFGADAVWLTNPAHDVVQEIDPMTNRVVKTVKVGSGPRFFAIGEGGVWTLNQGDGTVTRIDPARATVVATIDAGVPGGGGDLTTGGGWVWARGTDTLLTQIDPRTNTVVRRYGPPAGSGAAIAAFGSMWISAHDVSTIWRLPLPPASRATLAARRGGL
jgi:virginiamycin B lyase